MELKDFINLFRDAANGHSAVADRGFSFGWVSREFRIQDIIEGAGTRVVMTANSPSLDETRLSHNFQLAVVCTPSAEAKVTTAVAYNTYGVEESSDTLEVLINLLEFIKTRNQGEFNMTWINPFTNVAPGSNYELFGWSTTITITQNRNLCASNYPAKT